MLPCCAYLSQLEVSRTEAPFPWKDPLNLPPLSEEEPSHIPLLKKYDIPYIIDIHTHFFPEIVMKLIWKWFDSVNWKIAYRLPEIERIKVLEKNQITGYATLHYAHKKNMADWLNRYIFDNYIQWKGAIPFGTFFPEVGVYGYVQKAVEEYQFKGFKLHCEVSNLNLNLTELKETFHYLEKKNIPIVIHTGTAPKPGIYTGIKYFEPFIYNFPELPIIVAHLGAAEFIDYLKLLRNFDNLKFDTTMVFVDFLATGLYTNEIFEYIEKYPDRFHFGSDFPNIPYSLSHAIKGILELPISVNSKKKILYKNTKNLFELM